MRIISAVVFIRSTILIFYLLAASFALAQQSKPSSIEPLSGSFKPTLAVGYDAICNSSLFRKDKHSFFPTREKGSFLYKVIREQGTTFYTGEVQAEKLYLKIKLPVAENGTLWKGNPPIFETNAPNSPPLEEMKTLLSKSFELGLSHIGKDYEEGKYASRNSLCDLVDAQPIGDTVGGDMGEGFVDIGGRQAFLVTYNSIDRCYINGVDVRLKIYGWLAIDRASGLALKTSYKNSVYTGENLLSEETNDIECDLVTNQFHSEK